MTELNLLPTTAVLLHVRTGATAVDRRDHSTCGIEHSGGIRRHGLARRCVAVGTVSGFGIDAYVDGVVTPVALAVAQHQFARAVAAHLALHRRRAAGNRDTQVDRFLVPDV